MEEGCGVLGELEQEAEVESHREQRYINAGLKKEIKFCGDLIQLLPGVCCCSHVKILATCALGSSAGKC